MTLERDALEDAALDLAELSSLEISLAILVAIQQAHTRRSTETIITSSVNAFTNLRYFSKSDNGVLRGDLAADKFNVQETGRPMIHALPPIGPSSADEFWMDLILIAA